MSTRLTNTIRERIALAVLRHRFSESIEALIADKATFADEVYCDLYKKSDREKIDALPAGWLPEEASIGVKFDNTRWNYENIYFSGCVYGKLSRTRAPQEKSDPAPRRRVLHKHSNGCVKVYDEGHRLAKKFAALKEREAELEAAIVAAERQVNAALESATTINKLVEIWPEVEPFARQFDKSPIKVPAVPTEQLNKLLDLPVAA